MVFPEEALEPNSQGFLKLVLSQQAVLPFGHSLESCKGYERSTWAEESEETKALISLICT